MEPRQILLFSCQLEHDYLPMCNCQDRIPLSERWTKKSGFKKILRMIFRQKEAKKKSHKIFICANAFHSRLHNAYKHVLAYCMPIIHTGKHKYFSIERIHKEKATTTTVDNEYECIIIIISGLFHSFSFCSCIVYSKNKKNEKETQKNYMNWMHFFERIHYFLRKCRLPYVLLRVFVYFVWLAIIIIVRVQIANEISCFKENVSFHDSKVHEWTSFLMQLHQFLLWLQKVLSLIQDKRIYRLCALHSNRHTETQRDCVGKFHLRCALYADQEITTK